jgi:hypothetical protein
MRANREGLLLQRLPGANAGVVRTAVEWLEADLYYAAASLDDYSNGATLPHRVQQGVHRLRARAGVQGVPEEAAPPPAAPRAARGGGGGRRGGSGRGAGMRQAPAAAAASPTTAPVEPLAVQALDVRDAGMSPVVEVPGLQEGSTSPVNLYLSQLTPSPPGPGSGPAAVFGFPAPPPWQAAPEHSTAPASVWAVPQGSGAGPAAGPDTDMGVVTVAAKQGLEGPVAATVAATLGCNTPPPRPRAGIVRFGAVNSVLAAPARVTAVAPRVGGGGIGGGVLGGGGDGGSSGSSGGAGFGVPNGAGSASGGAGIVPAMQGERRARLFRAHAWVSFGHVCVRMCMCVPLACAPCAGIAQSHSPHDQRGGQGRLGAGSSGRRWCRSVSAARAPGPTPSTQPGRNGFAVGRWRRRH